jgi:glycosyltransferase involved in cell wall biosynthesis
MKIAFIGTRGIPPNYGGTETYVERLALELAAHGDEIWVYGSALDASPESLEKLKNYPASIHRIEVPSIPTKHADNFVRSLLSTIHVCFQREIEIVQFNNLGPSLFSILPRLAGKKIVGAIRALDSRREKWGPLARLYLRTCERCIYWFPHATTTNSKAIVHYYQRKYGATVHYTPGGTAPPVSDVSTRKIERWNLRKGNYILFAGRLVPEKGCHTLLEAFRSIAWPDIKLVIAGGESFAPEYVSELKQLRDGRVQFLGHVESHTMEALYANAFAFVLPSHVEGMSNSLLSAMAHGLPVVVSDIAENMAVIENATLHSDFPNGPGLYFRAGDAADLAAQLQRLRNNPGEAAMRGQLLRQHALTEFSWHNSARITRLIYLNLLKPEQT